MLLLRSIHVLKAGRKISRLPSYLLKRLIIDDNVGFTDKANKEHNMVRRVVTGHDENGKAIVLSDGPAPFEIGRAHV